MEGVRSKPDPEPLDEPPELECEEDDPLLVPLERLDVPDDVPLPAVDPVVLRCVVDPDEREYDFEEEEEDEEPADDLDCACACAAA